MTANSERDGGKKEKRREGRERERTRIRRDRIGSLADDNFI